ncbi:MAB_1171c family putative transporter [Streptomyces sp. IBSNAI002]|uniref:MAB_1171c family putative transporter n=1 Tax=Streptomyces sp. IBSNAI002 TaxID=3457500 RepID=UPI003FD1D09A
MHSVTPPSKKVRPIKTAVVIALWVVALWRLPAAIRIPRQRPLWTAFACVAVASTIARPAVKSIVILPTGINNLATVLQHILGMGGSTAVLFFVIAMAKPDALRWGRPLLYSCAAVGSALLVVFFALTPRPVETHNFFEANLGQPMGTAYCLTFLGYLTVAMTIASWLFLSYGRRAAGTSLRAGLRLLGVGAAFGAIYTSWRIGHMTTRLAGVPFVADDDTAQSVADLVEYTSIALIILGNSVPAVGVLWRTITYRRALTEVRPLWAQLIEAAPGVVLDEPVGRSPRLQLHRRLIEIWDVVLILRAHASAELLAAAHREAQTAGLSPDVTARLAEAMWIRVAWLAAVQGAEPRADASQEAADEQDTEFDAEVRKALGLARAFRDPRTTAFVRQHQEQPA